MLYYAILLVFVLEYLRPERYAPVLRSSILLPVGLLAISLLSNHKDRPKNKDILRHRNTVSLLIFLLLIIISATVADVKLYVWQFFTAIIGYFFLYYLISREINDLRKLKGLFVLLICSHLLMVVLTPEILLNPETRSYIAAGGTFLGDGNDFAWSVCIVLPFTIFLYKNTVGPVGRLLCLISFMLLTLCIIGTQSRGGALALCAVIVYQWLNSRKKIGSAVAILIVIVMIMAFAPPAFFERMNTIKDYESEGSAMGRIMAWKSGLRMALDHPFVGVGADHFSVKFGVEYRPPGIGITEIPWLNAHSIYFKVLGEFGFTGIILLLYIIYSNYSVGKRNIHYLERQGDRQSQMFRSLIICLNSSLIGFAVGGLFLSGIKYPHLFVITGLFTASSFIMRDTAGMQQPVPQRSTTR